MCKIHLLGGLAEAEKDARIRHLRDIMKLSKRYKWSAVRSLYGAVLDEIRRGLREWNETFTELEDEVMGPSDLLTAEMKVSQAPNRAYGGTTGVPKKVEMCKKWNYETCPREAAGKVCYYPHKCHSCYTYRNIQVDHKATNCPARLAFLKTKAENQE